MLHLALYDVQSGTGKQVLSHMRTNQSTTLGYGKRFQYDFVKRAKEQPGAGEYVKDSNACGKQHLSIKKSMPLYSFGTSDRDQAAKMFLSKDHEKSQKGWLSPGPTTAEQVCKWQTRFKLSHALEIHSWWGTSKWHVEFCCWETSLVEEEDTATLLIWSGCQIWQELLLNCMLAWSSYLCSVKTWTQPDDLPDTMRM
jgi:hypothetical protein